VDLLVELRSVLARRARQAGRVFALRPQAVTCWAAASLPDTPSSVASRALSRFICASVERVMWRRMRNEASESMPIEPIIPMSPRIALRSLMFGST
jgi:hypothetical protein